MISPFPSVALSPGSLGLCHSPGGIAGWWWGDTWPQGPETPFSQLALRGFWWAQLTMWSDATHRAGPRQGLLTGLLTCLRGPLVFHLKPLFPSF